MRADHAEPPTVLRGVGPRRRGLASAAIALVLASLAVLLVVPGLALGSRPATSEEIEAMLETVRSGGLGPGYTLVASRARVSSVNGRWAVADVGGTSPAGDQLQGARYIFRRSDPATLDWRTVTLGSSIGGCRALDALGVPARVIDDLKASNEVSYSCANPPPTAVPCLVTSRSDWFSVPRRRPTRCDLSLSGDDQPSSADLARLRALRWSRVTATSAVAVGAALPNHAPFDPYRVRVRFSGWTEAWCGPQFTRAIVTTRYGTSSGPLSYGACPGRP